MRQLRTLVLMATHVSAAELGHLKPLPSIRLLNLYGAKAGYASSLWRTTG